jgi:hypothetical protein
MTQIAELPLTEPSRNGNGPRDFSRKRKRVHFVIDDDTFDATPAIPADLLVEFGVRYEQAASAESLPEQFELLTGVLELVLLEDSYALLRKRMKDRHNPVELDQLNDIIEYLMSEYGLRPTQPSPDSSDGQPNPESGTNSTETTQPEASTSSTSPPTASST